MSDNQAGKFIEALGMTDRDLIKSIIAEFFFADFGQVAAVHGSPPQTVDVEHSVQPSLFGRQLPTTVTMGVELLFVGGGSAFSEKFTVSVGDPVLLLGLRNFVKTAASPAPAPTDIPLHYTQETMKAIPLAPFNSQSAIQIVIDSVAGTISFKTATGLTLQSDATTDAVAWPVLTALAGIFGMTLTSLKGVFGG